MDWFNYYGLIAVIIILIPNIIYAVTNKAAFENKFNNKAILVVEQIGRYGCMIFSIFNIPYTYLGFWFENALWVYIAVGGFILLLYCFGWIIFRKGNSLIKMLWLSITPTLLFCFCGIVICSAPLIVCAILFGIGHITVSCRNAEENSRA